MKSAYSLIVFLLLVLTCNFCTAQQTNIDLTTGNITVYGSSELGPNNWDIEFTAPGYTVAITSNCDSCNWGLPMYCWESTGCTVDQIASLMYEDMFSLYPNSTMGVNGQLFGWGGGVFFTASSFNSSTDNSGNLTVSGNALGSGNFAECDDPSCQNQLGPDNFVLGTSIQWQYQADFIPDPDVAGTYDLQVLTITSNVPIGSVAPNALNFPAQLLFTTSTAKSVALSNKGTAQMVVSSVSVTGDFAIANNYCMNGVKPGTHCNVGVTFKPTASGVGTGMLTFVTNAYNSPHVVNLVGTGTQIELSPPSFNYPLQLVGTTSTNKQVNVANIGATDVSINSIATTGDFVLRTATVNPCPSTGTLSGGTSCNVAVAFSPTAPNTRTGTLTISDSDPASPQVVHLNGIGTIVKLSAKKLSFPTTVLGYQSAAKQLVVTNVGSASLTLSGIAISGDFAQTNSCGPTLAAAMSCAITVTFSPTAINTRTGAITITDNGGGSPQTVALQGTGTQVHLSATTVNFGKITKGTTASKTLTLTNVGATNLTISGFTITGTNASDFSSPVNPPCAGSVASGATCTITLRFTSSMLGVEKATFSLFDDGGGSPQKVSLTGTGI